MDNLLYTKTLLVSQKEFPEDEQAREQGIFAELSLGDGTPVIIDGLSGIAGNEEIR
jgi:hypothetical protein